MDRVNLDDNNVQRKQANKQNIRHLRYMIVVEGSTIVLGPINVTNDVEWLKSDSTVLLVSSLVLHLVAPIACHLFTRRWRDSFVIEAPRHRIQIDSDLRVPNEANRFWIVLHMANHINTFDCA
ncbi:hypothetical protein RDWZM_008308, partial [Blomia tropicalis]